MSGVWLFGLGGFGFFLPYFTLYLRENAGLSGLQVGAVVALIPALGIFSQSIWGALADRSGRRKRVLGALALGTACGYLLLSQQTTFGGFLLATAVLAVFQTAFVPMCFSVSFAVLDDATGSRLGRSRMWGTLGFASCVLGFPWLLALLGSAGSAGGRAAAASPLLTQVVSEVVVPVAGVSEPLLGTIFFGAAIWLAIAGALTFALPEVPAERVRAHRGEWRTLLGDRDFMRLLLFTFLCYLSLQGPMHMFPLLVRSHGGGVEAISHMWFWMLVLEVPLVYWFGRTLSLIGGRTAIALGMAGASLRWLVSGYADEIGTLVTLVQTMHGVTVWGVMLGIPFYVDSIVPEQLRSTGQGLVAVAGASLAGVASNALAGWLIDLGGATAPARVGGWLALACVLALPLLLPRQRPRRDTPSSPAT